MQTRIKVKLLPDAPWVDGVLTTGEPARLFGQLALVIVEGRPCKPGEVFLIRGVEPGPLTQGLLNKADDTGYAIDPIAF